MNLFRTNIPDNLLGPFLDYITQNDRGKSKEKPSGFDSKEEQKKIALDRISTLEKSIAKSKDLEPITENI